MNSAALFLSLRYLRGKSGTNQTRKRMIGAILGIAVSLIPLVLVMQVAEGMIEGITRRYVEIGTFHLQVKNFTENGESETSDFIQEIKTIRGIKTVFPVVEGTALLYSNGGGSGAVVRGLPSDVYEKDDKLRDYLVIKEGEFDLSTDKSVLISSQMADKLRLKPGDPVKMLTGKSIPGRPIILRPVRLTVTGIFTTGYRDLDALSVIIPYRRGERLFQDPGSKSIGIKVENPYEDLRELVWNINRKSPPGWYVYTWYELEKSMYKSLENTRNLLFFIMALILIVATVNISSTIVMIVIERQRDIALLKSIGSSPVMIRRTFLFTGLWIGIIGTIIGLTAGVLISININEIIAFIEGIINGIRQFTLNLVRLGSTNLDGGEGSRILNPDYYLEKIPIHFKYINLCLISILSTVMSLIAAYFPARRAGRTVPLDILRRF